jgi:hypothetical protein
LGIRELEYKEGEGCEEYEWGERVCEAASDLFQSQLSTPAINSLDFYCFLMSNKRRAASGPAGIGRSQEVKGTDPICRNDSTNRPCSTWRPSVPDVTHKLDMFPFSSC